MGVEPIRCCHHGILNPARLPIPSRRHNINILAQQNGHVKHCFFKASQPRPFGFESLPFHAHEKRLAFASLRLLTNPEGFLVLLGFLLCLRYSEFCFCDKVEKLMKKQYFYAAFSSVFHLFLCSSVLAIFFIFCTAAVRRHCSLTPSNPLI